MNTKYVIDYTSLTMPAAGLSLLLFGLGSSDVLAQTVDDYSAEPPFSSSNGNSPSGSTSTIAAVEPSGAGALYQASYHKLYTDIGTGTTIAWGGALQAVFMDDSGRFREDNGIKGKLEDTNIDYVVDVFTDTSISPVRTRFRRFQQTGSGKHASLNPVGVVADMEDLNTIWNAGNMLAGINQSDLTIQRSLDSSGNFAEDAASKRFIFTWLDALTQGTAGDVDSGEVVDFVPEVFDPDVTSNWRYLGLADQGDAINLVKYIRGQDVTGWRSRLINLPGDGSDLERYWMLGDIVHSVPLAVNSPQESYDITYGDTTYKKFRDQYVHRRQMVYVGANDGMLHAFNGGVWNAVTRSFQTSVFADKDVSVQDHSLGAEMWAYVPLNLLPHLQWLKAVDYPHVYFVDGSPQAFDVNIFADDAIHPGGWGTILVTGMRFGGGAFDLDLDNNGNSETTRSSAVIVMDITDPEKPPVLLAELTLPELNFTTAVPTVVKARRPDTAGNYSSPAMNTWILVIGSGPNDLATATSEQRPMMVAWDLTARKYIELSASLHTPVSEPPGFYGGFSSIDRNKDYVDDVLYAGTVEGTEQTPAGRLKRLALNASAPAFGFTDGTAHWSTVIDVGKPIVARPAFIRSYAKKEDWLLFGTGRSFTVKDYLSVSEQRLFGVKDMDETENATELSSLVDATDTVVQVDALSGSKLVWDDQANNVLIIDDVKLRTFEELFAFMDSKPGWYKKLHVDQTAERVVTDALFLRSSAIFTSFLPEPGNDTKAGESFIHAVNYRTGTADRTGFLGVDTTGIVIDSVSAGTAEIAAPVLNIVQGNDPKPDQTTSEESGSEADSTISLVAGIAEGGEENVDFDIPPSVLKRISWELLEMSF